MIRVLGFGIRRPTIPMELVPNGLLDSGLFVFVDELLVVPVPGNPADELPLDPLLPVVPLLGLVLLLPELLLLDPCPHANVAAQRRIAKTRPFMDTPYGPQ